MDQDQKAILKLFERPFDNDEEAPSSGGDPIVFINSVATTTRASVVPGSDRPDLGYATTIPKGIPFSVFFRPHRRAAKDLSNYFMKSRNTQELVQAAQRVRKMVNEALFVYALSFVILRKPEFRRMRVPSVVEIFPNRFAQQEMLMQVQTQVKKMKPDEKEVVINQEFTGTLLKPEHRVSYWREDYGLNSHHWHWHLVFPVEMEINRDRKGEIFYYMHQQMLGRYDMERLSVGLNRVVALSSWRLPIEDGYFPKLNINNSGRAWGSRQDNTLIKDVNRDESIFGSIKISEMETWYGRLLDAVHQGYLVDRKGNRIPLSDDVLHEGKRGIEIIADAFEADPDLSVNFPFYGSFHDYGHVLMSFAHDPVYAHKEELSTIGDPSTSLRDPAFYLLHKLVDDFFQEYKLQQIPYDVKELRLEGVKIERAGVRQGDEANNLRTGWNTRKFEAGRGLDFYSPVPVQLNFTHLDHKPFEYHLQVTNSLSSNKEVTVRIYLAPMRNERGLPMSFMDQRLFWAEMDKYTVTLTPGQNQLVRSSLDSSITSPEEVTFRELEAGREFIPGSDDAAEFGACGCGWPQHLLLPRGTPQGMDYQLFFMLTDWDKDKVEQPPRNRVCTNAASFCGILDGKYPDSRPMGFPFDRRNPAKINDKLIETAGDFADQFDNTLIQDIKITFTNDMMEKA